MQEIRTSRRSASAEMSSPEAKLGLQVEDLWDIQEPQLSPSEKLNACFESIPVSAFPHAADSQGIVMSRLGLSSHFYRLRGLIYLCHCISLISELYFYCYRVDD